MKKTLSLALVLMLVLSLFAGMNFASAEGEPIVWMYAGDNNVTEDNLVLQTVREITGVNIQYNYISSGDYSAKLTALIGADTLPDIFSVGGQTAIDLRDAGKLLDMTEYLPEFGADILASYPEGELEGLVINQEGGIYGLNNRGGNYIKNLLIRKDWLEKVGLEVPTTLDELYEVMKAFTFDDPDGNGENDTYGYVGSVSTQFWQNIFSAYGIPFGNPIVMEDGTVTTYMKHPNYLKAIEYIRRMYAEGLMDPDFATLGNMEVFGRLWDGKVGMLGFQAVGTTNNWYPGRYTFDVPEDPADLFAQVILTNEETGEPAGASAVYPSQTSYAVVISAACPAPADAIKYVDYTMFTEEGGELMYLGVEGVMFEWTDKENGKYIRLGEYADDTVQRAAGAWVYAHNGGLTPINVELRTMNAFTQQAQAAEKAVATDWAFIYETLESSTEYGTSLSAVEMEAFANLIVTTGDVEAEYQAYIEQWEAEGGLEYEAEATEWWAAHN